MSAARHSKQELSQIMAAGARKIFHYAEANRSSTNRRNRLQPGDVILDSFAGSGTTVMQY
jgi:DNA modification methylase